MLSWVTFHMSRPRPFWDTIVVSDYWPESFLGGREVHTWNRYDLQRYHNCHGRAYDPVIQAPSLSCNIEPSEAAQGERNEA